MPTGFVRNAWLAFEGFTHGFINLSQGLLTILRVHSDVMQSVYWVRARNGQALAIL